LILGVWYIVLCYKYYFITCHKLLLFIWPIKVIVYFRKLFLVKIQIFLFCNDFRHVFDIAIMQKLSLKWKLMKTIKYSRFLD
jgi:hypothetical protein